MTAWAVRSASIAVVAILAVGEGPGQVCNAAHGAELATQTIRIETPGADGARCEARNDLGVWIVEGTPGSVTVLVSPKPLEVTCAAQGAGSPLGPTRVPSAKGEPASSVAVAGAITGGAAAIALAAAVPMLAPMVLGQLLVPAMAIGAGAGGVADEASRPIGYPATISVPLVGHARPVDPALLAAASLGIAVRGLTASEIAAAELESAEGAIVTRTAPGGRADRGGVRVGDIVVAYNDAGVASAAELEAMVRSATPGQPLKLRVWRERQWVEIALPGATERP